MKTVLFTGGGGVGNEAIHRLWQERYALHFSDADGSAFHPSIPTQRTHAVPLAGDAEFLKVIAALTDELSLDIIVPGVDEEILPLIEFEKERNDVIVMAPQRDYVALTMDKLMFARRLAQLGLSAPITEHISKYGEIGFPFFSKPRSGRGSRHTCVVENEAEAEHLNAYMSSKGVELLAQELLLGTEFTVMMSADSESNLRAVVPVEVELKRGITIRAKTVQNKVVTDACRLIHRYLPAKGCYNIQLILSPDGDVFPFEINPRISTTFCLTVAAGVDPISVYTSNEPSERLLEYKENVSLQRYWTNDIAAG